MTKQQPQKPAQAQKKQEQQKADQQKTDQHETAKKGQQEPARSGAKKGN